MNTKILLALLLIANSQLNCFIVDLRGPFEEPVSETISISELNQLNQRMDSAKLEITITGMLSIRLEQELAVVKKRFDADPLVEQGMQYAQLEMRLDKLKMDRRKALEEYHKLMDNVARLDRSELGFNKKG